MSSKQAQHELPQSLVRFATAGSVDDGKSTFIGRLLLDTESLALDHLANLRESEKVSGRAALAQLTDGLKAEREQGITIDVAYRYFSTKKRRFILADSPGHEQYTRNMATAASQAQVLVLLIDATLGISPQTRRHTVMASLLGVPRILVAINKMDLVGFSEKRYLEIQQEFSNFAAKLNVQDIRFSPVSAFLGDNIVSRSKNMDWYHGETVLEYLENIFVAADENLVDARFPVQMAIPLPQGSRGYAGSLISGRLRVGEEIVCLPRGKKTKIEKILSASHFAKEVETAAPDDPVILILKDELDISRGDLLCRPANIPHVAKQADMMVLWFSEKPLQEQQEFFLRQGTAETKVAFSRIQYRLDISDLKREAATSLLQNEIARCTINAHSPVIFDSAEKNREMGGCVFICPQSGDTVGAGLFLDRESIAGKSSETSGPIHREASEVGIDERLARSRTPNKTLWITGLSGSGKSTLAKTFERKMFDEGHSVFWLDGDSLRHGLCSDLGFGREARRENLRRAAHVAKLFQEKGFCVVCSFLSPFQEDRAMVKEILGELYFEEIYLSTPLEVCETRDPHGLYKKARSGEIQSFSGVSAPYEIPLNPALIIDTSKTSLEEACRELESILFR